MKRLGDESATIPTTEKDYFWAMAIVVHNHAQHEIDAYMKSEDYLHYIDHLKRRERERIMDEVNKEITREKEILLQNERMKMKSSVQQLISHEKLILENKLKLEQYEREQYEKTLAHNSNRLLEIQKRQELEKVSI